MADKLIIDWKEYNLIVEKLAIQIYESGFKPNLLIGIMRGGAPIIDVLSRVFKLKCAYLAVESYSGKGVEDEQGDHASYEWRNSVREGFVLSIKRDAVFETADGCVFKRVSGETFERIPRTERQVERKREDGVFSERRVSTNDPSDCGMFRYPSPYERLGE